MGPAYSAGLQPPPGPAIWKLVLDSRDRTRGIGVRLGLALMPMTAVWRDGKMVLGPLHLLKSETVPTAGTLASQALREIGVSAHGTRDEFEIAGLDEHGESMYWLS
ncbi:hypothetical protein [Streptomyces sp. NBC_00354]|uniref:hypothetical protein n=1 Tax=Streptomyces sp. NBC_00354 TaxID=2975723 RepID=UPI002E25CE24